MTRRGWFASILAALGLRRALPPEPAWPTPIQRAFPDWNRPNTWSTWPLYHVEFEPDLDRLRDVPWPLQPGAPLPGRYRIARVEGA